MNDAPPRQPDGSDGSDGSDDSSASAGPPARRSPAAVLAWSEDLLDTWTGAEPGLALWVPRSPAVAIGLAQSAEGVADLAAMEHDGVRLLRRQSGGGAVLLASGVLCWEACATEDAVQNLPGGGAGIRPAYAALAGPVRAGLAGLGIDTVLAGVCDIAVRAAAGGERKIAGMAQLRRHGRVLVHGCALVSLDPSGLEKYLPLPADADAPDYRRGRSHRDFCVSVAEVLSQSPPNILPGRLTERLAGAVAASAAGMGWTILLPPEELPASARRLLEEKYSSAEWNLRRVRGQNSTGNLNDASNPNP